jgi:hypothetical protein
MLGRTPSRSGQLRKISPPPRFDRRTVHPVASRYTDWVIPPHDRIWKLTIKIKAHFYKTTVIMCVHQRKHLIMKKLNSFMAVVISRALQTTFSHIFLFFVGLTWKFVSRSFERKVFIWRVFVNDIPPNMQAVYKGRVENIYFCNILNAI